MEERTAAEIAYDNAADDWDKASDTYEAAVEVAQIAYDEAREDWGEARAAFVGTSPEEDAA